MKFRLNHTKTSFSQSVLSILRTFSSLNNFWSAFWSAIWMLLDFHFSNANNENDLAHFYVLCLSRLHNVFRFFFSNKIRIDIIHCLLSLFHSACQFACVSLIQTFISLSTTEKVAYGCFRCSFVHFCSFFFCALFSYSDCYSGTLQKKRSI